eukprot:CAMPEP_0176383116 /NCGR_PEP_ID=MMETSP0126-20121128/33230_1 /TAXON_ID=141414 ORGANISM="Strombidinopsis acuminatum, Strain SPMC142" /NCGR_SAMPLE_ID=MMETSP0126 /ASSEMBLY_ACC=CAM_ASM_000229 /LENGTH=108 /DNA_ID=CAMNT_0017747959 /DNA_START=1465 /DNA_END=1791 /DNA_ORIENTATION=-
MDVAGDTFLGLIQSNSITYNPKSESAEGEEAKVVEFHSEKDILTYKTFSDDKDKLKSLDQIKFSAKERNFAMQKGSFTLFRFEEIIYQVYPHLAAHRRRGMNTKDVFL